MSSKLVNSFFAKSLPDLYLKEDLADVYFAFKIGGETIKVPAHKTILAVASPVFRAMFFGPLKENEVVEIVDVDDSAFKEFLQFFYLPEITLSMENIEAVIRLADKYDMMECLDSGVEFLERELTNENMIWGLQLAISMNNQKLKKFCERNIQFLTIEYLNTDIFLHCERKVLHHILELEMWRCGAADLFKACIAWAKTACGANGLEENVPDNLKNQLGDCFYLIQFAAMNNEEIGMIMSNKLYKGLFTKEELTDILCIRSIDQFKSEIFRKSKRPPLKWDANAVLKCLRLISGSNRYNITQRDSTWFSANVPLQLGEIGFYLRVASSGATAVDFSISVIEHPEQILNVSDKNGALLTGTFRFDVLNNARSITLTEPIFINPNKMYEIRLENPSRNDVYALNYFGDYEFHLNNNVKIKFHENPFDNVTKNDGSVQFLKFNEIEK